MRKLRELLPTLILIVALAALEDTRLRFPFPGMVLMLAIAWTAFRAGTASGLISATLSFACLVWMGPGPLRAPRSPLAENIRLLVSGLSLPAMALLVGELKRRHDAASARATELAATLARQEGFERVRESEARLQALVATAIEGIITIDEGGIIDSVNAAAVRIFGYDRNELLGRNIKMLMPEPHASAHDGYLRDYHGTGHATVIGRGRQIVARRKDGSTFPIELAVSEMTVRGRRMFTGMVRDVSERVAAEARLRESHARLNAIIRGTSDGVFIKDMDGRFLMVNAAIEQRLGRAADQIVGKRSADLATPEEAARSDQEDREVLESGRARDFERTIEMPDGVRTFLTSKSALTDADGHVLGIFGISKDITERKQIEQEMRRLMEEAMAGRARLEAIIEQMPAGLCIAEAPSGKLVRVNAQLARMWRLTKLDSSDITEYAQFEGYATDGHRYEPHQWPLARAVTDGEVVTGEEVRIIRGDGTEAWVTINAGPIRDAEGNIVAAVAALLDVTDEKAAREAVRQHQAQVAHLARVSTMSELTSGLAHELNQPLGAILNYAGVASQLLEAHEDAPPTLTEAVDEIAAEARRAGEIIKRMRGFVRRQTPQVAGVDLNHIVRESAALMRADLRGAGVRLDVHLSDPPPLVHADVVQIQQVLVNLIRNAIDAMSDKPMGERELVISTSIDAHARGRVSVRDSGCGLDAEQKQRLFEPFYTTKPQGLGIGLNISRTIVESHGGSMSVESNPAGAAGPSAAAGITIHFTLPLQKREFAHESGASTTAADADAATERQAADCVRGG